jgi:hypothetical protein
LTERYATLIPPYRLPRRALGEGWKLQIRPEFIECVAFICDHGRPGGTAFFVEVDDDTGKRGSPWTYLVTSAHSFDFIKGEEISARISTHPEINATRGFEDIPTRKGDWFIHDKADVAAIISPADPERHKIQRLPVDTFINRDYRFDVSRFKGRGRPAMEQMMVENFPKGIAVEVGHDLYFPGLFVQSAGKNTMLPIVRFGNIARMPGEELLTLESPLRTMQIRGYLAESHSWGGHSGSPVFWFYTYNINIPIEVKEWRPPESRFSIKASPPARTRPANVMIGNGWAQGLMGLVSGHYDIPTKAKDKSRQTLDDIQLGINAGIAIVTPAENIRELLMRSDVVDDRKERAEQIEEPAAVADFEHLSTRQKRKRKNRDVLIPAINARKFFDDLTKATRRRKPS